MWTSYSFIIKINEVKNMSYYKKVRKRIADDKERRTKHFEKRAEKLVNEIERQETIDERTLKNAKLMEAKERKVKAQNLFDEDKIERQRQQDRKNEAKTEKASLFRAYESARLNIERDRQIGLSQEEIRFKYLNKDARIREMNKEAERGNRDVLEKTRARFRSHIDDMY